MSVPVKIALLWMLAVLPLLAFAGRPTVSRAQEARVLETARQMRGGGLDAHLLPTLNGLPRLKKPPLCYWMAAGAYDVFGVGTLQGRLPTILVAWLLVGLTYRFGRDLYDRPSGLWAAGMLLGSFMFFRFARSAETDPPASLGVALAAYAIWRGSGLFGAGRGEVEPSSRLAAPLAGRESGTTRPASGAAQRHGARWFHLSAVGIALAAMAKGGPAGFPILFLLLLTVAARRWRLPWEWVRSGAPLTAALLSAWWLYVSFSPAARQIAGELGQFIDGGEHHAPFYHYFAQLLAAVAPWTGFAVVAVVGGLLHWRDEPRHRVPLLWAAAVLAPLLLLPKRQDHYLQPILPPLMLLAGHLVARGTASDGTSEERSWVRWLGVGTAIAVLLGGPAIPIAALRATGGFELPELVLGACLSLGGAASLVLLLGRRAWAGLAVLVGGSAVAMPVLFGLWLPRVTPGDWRSTAEFVAADAGPGPLRFYGPELSLPLCFHLRREIPLLPDAGAASAFLRENPTGRLLIVKPTGATAAPPPPGTQMVGEVFNGAASVKVFAPEDAP